MNGLPEDLDTSFFHGRRLEQVCLGEYQTQLRFDGNVSVFLECEFTLDGERHTLSDSHFLRLLLGHIIGAASCEGAGDLRLDWGSHVLILHDSNVEYESYTIDNGHGLLVV